MSNVIPLRTGNPANAAEMIASFPPAGKIKRKQMRQRLPLVLETALALLLDDRDPRGYETGCRLLASTIARLK